MSAIYLDVEQGSRAWVEARLGIPTATGFNRIVTATGRQSRSRDDYLAELTAEYLTGEPYADFGGTEWMDRGRALEPDARASYQLDRGATVQQIGFVFRDEKRLVGCSPDGLVGDDGLLELKCPSAPVHIKYLVAGCGQYYSQLQGQLWVTGRKWVDFMSYHPDLPEYITRVGPDPAYQAALDKALPEFLADLVAWRERLVEMGALKNSEP